MLLIRPLNENPWKSTGSPLVDNNLFFNETPAGEINVGWAKYPIIPDQRVRLTGFKFKPYSSIGDTVFVKCMVFKNDKELILLLSYDLWLIHPGFADKLKNRIEYVYPNITGIYLTATHTHSSIGGWGSGLIGKLITGGNSEETTNFLLDQSINAIKKAMDHSGPSYFEFSKFPTENLVRNRLDPEHGTVDHWLRNISIVQENKHATITSFAAHPVYLNRKMSLLSADYPGIFSNHMENQVDLSIFASGAMGSHSPVRRGDRTHSGMSEYGKKLSELILSGPNVSNPDSSNVLKFWQIGLKAPAPQVRISSRLVLNPVVSKWILPNQEPSLNVLRIGNTLLIGLPIELSGEYIKDLEYKAEIKGLNLMLTSFNGSYLGYAPKSEYYYKISHPETRSLNWYGPSSGDYFSTIIKQIIDRTETTAPMN